MKNKKIFSAGLYVEGLRQLRIIGIIFTMILGLEAIYLPIASIFPYLSGGDAVVRSVSGSSAHPLLLFSFILIAPLMTLYLFHFLNKRGGSDFYHALPHTRTCLYLSYMAAILTWIAFIIVFTSGISMLTILLCGKYLTLLYSSLLFLMLGSFLASALVCAAVSLAMTVTGTVFANVIVSGLILLLPGFVASVALSTVVNALPMLSSEIYPILSEGYNIVTDFVFKGIGLSYGDPIASMSSLSAFAYTAVLAVIYFIIACILFNYRASESAAKAAPNRVLQAVYRILVTMVICIIACVVLFDVQHRSGGDYWVPCIILYTIAVLVYFLYELITTRRAKNLVKIIPGLAIVLVLNVAFYLGMFGLYSAEAGFRPVPEDVIGISVIQPKRPSYGYNPVQELAVQKGQQVEITDKEAIANITASFSENMSAFDSSYDTYMRTYVYNSDIPGMVRRLICFNTDSGKKIRTVCLSEEADAELTAALSRSEAYRKCWQTLPEPIDKTLRAFDQNLAHVDTQALFDTYRSEYESLTFEQIYATETETPLFSFTYETQDGFSSISVSAPVYVALMPKTCNLYLSALERDGMELQDGLVHEAVVYLYDDQTNSYITYYYYYDSKEKIEYLLSQVSEQKLQVGVNFIQLHIYDEKYNLSDVICIALKDDIVIPGDK